MSVEDEPSTWPPCVHHWVVASPEPGLTMLPARCVKCGWRRRFVAEPVQGFVSFSEVYEPWTRPT